MSTKHLIIVIGAGFFLFAGGILIGRSFGDGGDIVIRPAQDTATTTGREEAPSPAAAATSASVPEGAVAASCESEERSKAVSGGRDYERGTILVSFKAGVSYAAMKAFIDSLGLRLHNDPDPAAFEEGRWATVRVERGSEFKWICDLRDDAPVRNAGINPIFNLAE